MSDAKSEAAAKAVGDLNQLAAALSLFRRSCTKVPDAAAAVYLHRAAGLMEVVVHDLNSVAEDLGHAFGVTSEPAATDWPAMAGGRGPGLGREYAHGQGCGCGCERHEHTPAGD